MGRWVGLAALFLLAGSVAIAQPATCEISQIRGAASPEGATATMRVVNDGRPCGLTLYGIPEQRRNPATDGVFTQAPKHGIAKFAGARVQYTPDPGYVGDDAFTYEARSADATGRSILLKVQFKVTVRPAP